MTNAQILLEYIKANSSTHSLPIKRKWLLDNFREIGLSTVAIDRSIKDLISQGKLKRTVKVRGGYILI